MILSPPHHFGDRGCGYCGNSKQDDHYALDSQVSSNLRKESVIMGTTIIQMFCSEYDELINMGLGDPGHTFDLNRLYEAQVQSTRFRTKFEPLVYKKYQIHVHNDEPDDVTESSFKRFLCDTPFPKEESRGVVYETAYWTYHELYYLDDKLIAISVLDFLPLGTLSGLKELQMCQQLGYSWYYLGYYIEDCVKMKYKLKFGGELLDMCNEVFFPLEMKDETYDDELEIENSGKPLDYKDSAYYGKEVVNVAEDIYGTEHTDLRKKFNISSVNTVHQISYQEPYRCGKY
ncbi:Arginyl-tRNA--protein transferase 1 [Candida viswanathii]|uniref:Arginyl-tRNA--protein transferase 1 n=1 Tax=Candida viswanathii TaxID=5486 RepID=A0A367YN95_9ASCO|nr:Arginyl-tRNA--protein transferase 1 [Candida viswanathii]